MKKLDLSSIESNVRGMILENKTLDHIVNSYAEGFTAILKTLNCDPNEITILSGAETTQAGQDYEVTDGWAAYQGEIFQIDAGAFTAAGGEIGVWVIKTTHLDTDPVKFNDGNEFNVNEIRKLKLESGAAASGEKDWDDVVSIYGKWINFPKPASGTWEFPVDGNPGGEATQAPVTQYYDPAYLIDQSGFIHFRGAMVETSGSLDFGGTFESGGFVFYTFPEGMRPEKVIGLLSLTIWDDAANGTFKQRSGFSIRPNGDFVFSRDSSGGGVETSSIDEFNTGIIILDDIKPFRP